MIHSGSYFGGLAKFKGNIANTKEVDQYIEGIKTLEGALSELGSTAIQGAETLVNAQFERQKKNIQDQISLIDERRDKEIAMIEQTATSEEEKAQRIAVANARADALKKQQEQRAKEVALKQARFEKAAALVKIIAETAAAVVHQLSSGDPYTAFARALAVGAIGAAQAAVVAAQPLPAYAEGTAFHPGGKAIVGDGGRSELVVTPQGKLVETPALPTIMDLQRGTMVLPDAKQALSDYYGGMTVQKYNEMSGDSSLLNEIKGLRRDVKNKKETHWHRKGNNWEFITNNAGNYQKWIDQNI
jgi:hypothetical protein